MNNLSARIAIQGFFLFVSIIFFDAYIQAQFVGLTDNTSKNRFLGLDMSMCKTTTENSSKNYQKSYDCGNSTISSLLNLNFLSPQLLGKQFYIFNNFMYWMSKDDPTGKQAMLAQQDPESYFSGSGVFMIVLGTSSYLKQIIAPTQTCPEGKTLLMIQLKYNDGNSITTWSQDSICLAPTDSFQIQVTHDADNTVASFAGVTPPNAQGIDWMKDTGPATGAYGQAGTSPRKVRLVLKNSKSISDQVEQTVESVVKTTIVK
jgi:hypothetical protein